MQAFAIITISLAVLLACGSQYRRYRIESLHHDFASLSTAKKLARLEQLASFGADGLTGIVAALCDDDQQVAVRAHEILRAAQKSWIVQSSDQATANQMSLVGAIREFDATLPAKGITLAQDLLQHTIQSSVDQSDAPTRQLYFAATATMQQISMGAEPRESSATPDDVRDQPLPVAHLAAGADWTDWPPRADDNQPIASAVAQANFQTARPIVYRKDAEPLPDGSLQTVPEHEVVLLRDVRDERTIDVAGPEPQEDVAEAEPQEDVAEAEPLETAPDQPTATQPDAGIVEKSPWQGAAVGTVIELLGSQEGDLRVQAAAELARRGFNDQQVSIAAKIVGDDANAKLALIHSLADASAVDPRPWLIMLLRDQTREVKLRAISALATMKDPWVTQELRLRLVEEPDQTVAFRIRRILNLR